MISAICVAIALAAAPSLPTYPGARAIPLHGEMVYEGIPLDLLVQETPDPAAKVLTFYRQSFLDTGLVSRGEPVPMPPFLGITGVDPDHQQVFLAMVMPLREGGCTVITGVADFAHAHPVAGQLYGLPIHPSAHELTAMRMGGPEQAASILYVAQAKPDEIREYYDYLLTRGGYVSEPGSAKEQTLFRSKSGTWQLEVRPDERDPTASVVSLIQMESTP